MPTSSSPKPPLRKTYRIERQLCDEHNLRMKQAIDTWGRMVCPYCYKPTCECKGD
jgi:hypothetical protein